MSDIALDADELLTGINNLLSFAGLKKRIQSSDELTNASSSLFVTLFETLFSCQLLGINPNPTTHEHYCSNTQIVLDGIAQKFDINLHHISGEDIVRGDRRSLYNLTAILQRIVNIIQCTSVQSELGSDYFSLDDTQDDETDEEFFNNLRLSQSEASVPLQTSDSTQQFADELSSKNPSYEDLFRGRVPDRLECLRALTDDAGCLFAHDARDAVLKGQKRILQEEKVDAARRRRQHFLERAAAESGMRNRRSLDTSQKAWQHRWLEDLEQEERAFQLARTHTGAVAVQQVYRAYLARLRRLRVAEEREVSDRVKRLKEGRRQQNENLANLYEERIRMLSSCSHRVGADDNFVRESRRASERLRLSFSEEQKRALSIALSESRQDRERMMLQRADAHRCLLELLLYDKDHQKSTHTRARFPHCHCSC